MTRLAAIDIGTNSVKMTVADTDPSGALRIVREASEVTRLGAGVDAAGSLDNDAIARTLAALSRFADEARALGTVRTAAAGTSALRDAANGPEFLARAAAETGTTIEIISGDREALLAFAAVSADPDLGLPVNFSTVVFDIGGGSTELVYGMDSNPERSVSLDIGAVRITERFLHSDPPTTLETEAAAKHIRTALHAFAPPPTQPILVGLGGSVVNMAAVALAQATPPLSDMHAVLLFGSDAEAVFAQLSALPVAARRTVPGLEPARADVIVGGALIVLCLLEHFGSDRFLVSTRGLRYGLLAEMAASEAV